MHNSEYLTGLTDEEVRRWIWLRSIEWANWPIFISQPLIPIAIIFFKWWLVLVMIYTINIFWSGVRYKYFDPLSATLAAFFVKLRWPAAIGCGVYLFIHSNYELAMVACLWPLLSGLLVLSGKLERIQELLNGTMGYNREPENDGLPNAIQRNETIIRTNQY
ncbi:MAG: hypothetical protein ABSB78_06970 [Bacteroidota bacterium]